MRRYLSKEGRINFFKETAIISKNKQGIILTHMQGVSLQIFTYTNLAYCFTVINNLKELNLMRKNLYPWMIIKRTERVEEF